MYLSRVNAPMGGTQEAHTSLEVRRRFSYANVRKATYRGIKTFLMYILTITIYTVSVFKFCVIGGIFLIWFADSVLFTMMIKTEFDKPVDTLQEIIDREMAVGISTKNKSKLK